MKPTSFRIAFVVALLATSGFAQEREERINRSFDLGSSGELTLTNVSGDIRVEGTSGSEVVVEAVKRAHGRVRDGLLDEVRVDFAHTGDRLRIETRYPDHDDDDDHGHRHRGGVSVDYRLQIPTGTEVELTSVSGRVTLTGVEGESQARSVSGDVEVRDCVRLTQARSVSGNVVVRGVRSNDSLEVASVSGDVTMEDIQAEELDVKSVSGDVHLREVRSEEGEFDSVSGDLTYSGEIVAGGNYEFKSHSGDVVLEIGPEIGFELESKTFSGDIESDFEMRIVERGRRGRKLSAVIGDGSAVVEATTFSGDIRLRRR